MLRRSGVFTSQHVSVAPGTMRVQKVCVPFASLGESEPGHLEAHPPGEGCLCGCQEQGSAGMPGAPQHPGWLRE